MEDNIAKENRYTKYIQCPGCAQPLELGLQLVRMDDDLYIWYEGLCSDCCHKVVDPMPILRAEFSDSARIIMAN